MKVNKTIAVTVLLCGLLVGGLVAGVFLSQRPAPVEAAPAVQQVACSDDAACDQNETNEAGQADKADDTGTLQGQTSLTADQAQKIAEDANPGAKTLAVELDRVNENGGAVIYEVELDNGLDIKVDANNGKILGSDVRDAD